MKTIRKRLTYANVISTICLFLLLGGGAAYAATHLPKNSVGSKQLKKGAVTPAKLSTAAKSALTGPQGPKGAQGPKGETGAAGTKGETGAAGTALAYAKIESNGTVNGSLSKGITSANVTNPSTGHYCINGLSFVPHNVVATSQFLGVGANVFLGDFPGCSGANVSIETWTSSTGTAFSAPFEILLN